MIASHIRPYVTPSIAAKIGTVKDRMHELGNDARWLLSQEAKKTHRMMMPFYSFYKGKRAFIIGNGPSLNEMDLSPLKNEFTFGLNRIYLMFDKLCFETSFYVSVNRLVLNQCRDDIKTLRMPKFISQRSRNIFPANDSSIFLRSASSPLDFSLLPQYHVWESGTVTYVALQLAFYMGFNEVYLIGVDHRFSSKGPANQEVVSQGNDPDHFDKNYFGKGFKWQLPDLELSELGYNLANKVFSDSGRKIFDATINGALTCYPKVDFSSIF